MGGQTSSYTCIGHFDLSVCFPGFGAVPEYGICTKDSGKSRHKASLDAVDGRNPAPVGTLVDGKHPIIISLFTFIYRASQESQQLPCLVDGWIQDLARAQGYLPHGSMGVPFIAAFLGSIGILGIPTRVHDTGFTQLRTSAKYGLRWPTMMGNHVLQVGIIPYNGKACRKSHLPATSVGSESSTMTKRRSKALSLSKLGTASFNGQSIAILM